MIGKVLIFVGTSILVTLLIAVGLILSQRPTDLPPGDGLNFTGTLDTDRPEPQALSSVRMRDGYEVQVRFYPSLQDDAPLLVLVHGSGWHGMQFDGLARQLSATADVVVPDLRGHGTQPGRRGDIDYIDQFEDDLADLITAQAKPGQKVILGGHSSGGGLVVRFAGGVHRDLIDGAVLLAPFLKHNAPTMRPDAGGWSNPLLRRIIGLSMLNTVKITALNHLTIMQFRMPQVVLDGPLGDTATTRYSYRLNTGFAPRGDYLGDVAKLPPFVLIAGTADEAFVATAYEASLSGATDKGQYVLVDGVGHLDIVNAPETAAVIEGFLNEF
ncbi:Alpha/beta hydrolase [Sulfitobacter noctilucae]|uniref:alpha/beta hydrolase n=1 Tax=Sulfitobacter noctilucae TaxID=1342302 RepID=UPI00046A9F92|nr:alpha/beta fold hydrolase [Sulfitobacter noctilucae]KIN61298.1 Alpha/beta hydrolase [Sulfitobacter noctilucae]